MRDTAPPNRTRKEGEKKKEDKAEDKKERKDTGVERKLREVQSQGIKLREEVLKRIDKIE